MKYSIEKAIYNLKKNKNNAVAFVYEKASFSNGLLNGKTVTVKDVFATKDAPTQSSSKILESFEPQYDAEIVSKLKASGAAIVAKTHMDELAMGGTGTFSAWGVIKNPVDPKRHVGGSSSGAAATLDENIAIAIGSDTGDSVRLPASFVGKVGFKPSYGAVSRYGLFSYSSSLDTVGWLTHDVKNSIEAAQTLFGIDKKDMTSKEVKIDSIESKQPKKIAMLDLGRFCRDYASEKYEKLFTQLKNSGANITMIPVDEKLLTLIDIVYQIISFSESCSNNSGINGIAFGKRQDGKDWSEIMTNTRSKNFGRMVQKRFALGAFYLNKEDGEDYLLLAQKVRRIICNMYKDIYSEYDLLVYPSSGEVAHKYNEKRLDNFMSSILTSSNLYGNPSITLPWAKYKGMPYGIQLDTDLYKDKELLSYALWMESLLKENYE